jgi:hypothetical protein
LLKKFPVNGSSIKEIEEKFEKKSQNNEKISIKNVISAEISAIKQEIEQANPVVVNDEIKLLGELLGYLRQSKEMSLLMLCRQIKSIKIVSGIAEIDSDDENISSLMTNEKYHSVIGEFFKQKGLGFRVFEKVQTESAVDVLNKLLGGKLIVK